MSVLSGLLGIDVSALLVDTDERYESMTIKGRGRSTVWRGLIWQPPRRNVRGGMAHVRRLIPPKDRHVVIARPELAAAQRLILDRVIGFIPPHEAATAFWSGRSIKENARRHHWRSYLFKTDFRDFFSSITTEHVARTLAVHLPHLSRAAVSEISKLTTMKGALPMGASTSPHLSNLVMHGFDEAVSREAKRVGAVYTRYADDIAVSAGSLSVIRDLDALILDKTIDMGLARHERKTHTYGPDDARIVTGLDVSRERLRPAKPFRKRVAAMARICVLHPHRAPKLLPRVIGSLCHWHDVAPADPALARILLELREDHFEAVPRTLGVGSQPQPTTSLDPYANDLDDLPF